MSACRPTRWLVAGLAGASLSNGLTSCGRAEDPLGAEPVARPGVTQAIVSQQHHATHDGGVRQAAAIAGCPADMALVDGEFCPDAEQVCREHHPQYRSDQTQSERCTLFEQPSRCRSDERELMRYCIDRYEWPNQPGVKPRVLTQWTEAKALCEGQGKRLCSDSEWLFACEGPEMLPYTYGFRRDPTSCVLDRMYIPPKGRFLRWEACQGDATCRQAFERVDQREPAGSFSACVSPFGVYDMNGNVNEWVEIPGASYPRRSGLKGGWWGPVRDRCRPTVRFHKEDDWGYEVGFRCCQDAAP